MAKATSDLDLLVRRLERLEKQNFWMKHALAAGLLVAGLGWLAGPRPAVGEAPDNLRTPAVRGRTVTAERFLLVDGGGKPRAELALAQGEPFFRLADEDGKPRLAMNLGREVSGLSLLDGNGKYRAGLSLGKDGPFIRLDDARGRQRVGCGVGKEGTFLRMDDEGGRPRVVWSVGAGGSSLSLVDGAGNTFFSRRW
jgi:hypothetical protein